MDPRLTEALGLINAGKLMDARQGLVSVLRDKPEDVQAKYLLGVIALHEGAHADALTAFDAALKVKPTFFQAIAGRCNALSALARWPEAEQALRQAIALRPDVAEAWCNCGAVIALQGRRDEAMAMFDRALELQPTLVEALTNRGQERRHLRRFTEARADYLKALALAPSDRRIEISLLLVELSLCDWQRYDSVMARLDPAVLDAAVCTPFEAIRLLTTPAAQFDFARRYAARKYPFHRVPRPAHVHDRIRIGYVSSDFRNHATAFLIAGLLEAHDRDRFEVTAFSVGRTTQDEMRRRIEHAVERFEDVQNSSDQQIVDLMRAREIDIAVDLAGYSADARLGIFGLGAAPVQTAFLCFPGTTGTSFMDYIIADRHVIPEADHPFYSEKVVTLPDTYQPNDDKRAIAADAPSRAALGLPDDGIVFCCFNLSFKITPPLFDIWMRLLRDVDGSVLWLLEVQPEVTDNLRREAQARGVDPDRLVFADFAPQAEHLARLRQADLVLDTLPYNAHTTASDALWVGVPVLTCMGAAFEARVAASLLHALGVPELITSSLADYERLARDLACDRARLAQVRAKVEAARATGALFDTRRFTRNLETAYTLMHARALRGEPPAPQTVPPVA